jgi:hypothetical protein
VADIDKQINEPNDRTRRWGGSNNGTRCARDLEGSALSLAGVYARSPREDGKR